MKYNLPKIEELSSKTRLVLKLIDVVMVGGAILALMSFGWHALRDGYLIASAFLAVGWFLGWARDQLRDYALTQSRLWVDRRRADQRAGFDRGYEQCLTDLYAGHIDRKPSSSGAPALKMIDADATDAPATKSEVADIAARIVARSEAAKSRPLHA